MKFIGEPNLTIIDYEKSKKVFQFDEKGEFITEDINLIEWIKKYKGFLKTENQVICKKCGLPFENKGSMLAHCKKEHPKEG